MNILCFDTETLGLYIKDSDGYDPHYTLLPHYDSARLLQISWCIVDAKDNLVKTADYITANDFKINNSHIHGITEQICKGKGVPISQIINAFAEDLKNIRLLVGHNLDFDLRILKSELYRIILKNEDPLLIQKCNFIIGELERIEIFDTMKSATTLYKLHHWPKLIALHKSLFGFEFIGAHNSLNDVLATVKCFLKMVFGTTLIEPKLIEPKLIESKLIESKLIEPKLELITQDLTALNLS
jgi:DNA polymerase-3 subunit alpha